MWWMRVKRGVSFWMDKEMHSVPFHNNQSRCSFSGTREQSGPRHVSIKIDVRSITYIRHGSRRSAFRFRSRCSGCRSCNHTVRKLTCMPRVFCTILNPTLVLWVLRDSTAPSSTYGLYVHNMLYNLYIAV